MPGKTRGRCGWVSAVTTPGTCVLHVGGSRLQPGDLCGPRPPTSSSSRTPQTRPLGSGAPLLRTVHAFRQLPAAAHVVEPGAARVSEDLTEPAADVGGRARATHPARPPVRAPIFPLSRREGGDTPRATPPRRLPRPLAAAAVTRPGYAGQPDCPPPPLARSGPRRAVSPCSPSRATQAAPCPVADRETWNCRLPSGDAAAAPALRESVRLVAWRSPFSQVCPSRHIQAIQLAAKKCRMHELIYLFCNSCKKQ